MSPADLQRIAFILGIPGTFAALIAIIKGVYELYNCCYKHRGKTATGEATTSTTSHANIRNYCICCSSQENTQTTTQTSEGRVEGRNKRDPKGGGASPMDKGSNNTQPGAPVKGPKDGSPAAGHAEVTSNQPTGSDGNATSEVLTKSLASLSIEAVQEQVPTANPEDLETTPFLDEGGDHGHGNIQPMSASPDTSHSHGEGQRTFNQLPSAGITELDGDGEEHHGQGTIDPQEYKNGKNLLEDIIGPLLINSSHFEEDFMPIIKDNFTSSDQVRVFIADQKWDDASKKLFYEELQRLGNAFTMDNLLISWAFTVDRIFKRHPEFTTIDKRKPIWKVMQTLRRNHEVIYEKIQKLEIFQGGVFGVDSEKGKKYARNLPYNHERRNVIIMLQLHHFEGNDWKGLAERTPGVTSMLIQAWQQKGDEKATELTLNTFGTSRTIQDLYEALIDMGRGDIAKLLES